MSIAINQLVLIIKNQIGKVDKNSNLSNALKIKAESSASITLVDPKTGKVPADIEFKRKGKNLIVKLKNDEFVEIENFYSDNAAFYGNEAFTGSPINLSSDVVAAVADNAVAQDGISGAVAASSTPNMFESAITAFGGIGFAGGISSWFDKSKITPTAPPVAKPVAEPVFTIAQYALPENEQSTVPFSMKTGDVLAVVRDGDNITGYTLNGVPVSQSFVDAFIDSNFTSSFYNSYLNQYFEFADVPVTPFDRIEAREDGIYVVDESNRYVLLSFHSGKLGSYDNVQDQLDNPDAPRFSFFTDINGPFHVEATAAKVDFSVGKYADRAFSGLESVSVITDDYGHLEFSNAGATDFMAALKSIWLESKSPVDSSLVNKEVELDFSNSTNVDLNGIYTGANFMAQLETITLIGNGAANASMSISNSGAADFMPSLREILIEVSGKGNKAALQISASANMIFTEGDDVQQLLGERFMDALESISVISIDYEASFSFSTTGTDYFMPSLQHILVQGANGAKLSMSTSASGTMIGGESLRGDYLMQALETIEVIARGENAGDVSLSISAEGGINYMASLQSIYVEGGGAGRNQLSISHSLAYTGATGVNFMGSLETITLLGTGAESSRIASLSIRNQGANVFMASLDAISVEGRENTNAHININNFISFNIAESGEEELYLDGDDFMQSLTSIEAIASEKAYAYVDVFNQAGNGFMSSLERITVEGLNGFVRLTGDMGRTGGDITVDFTQVQNFTNDLNEEVSEYSLSILLTHGAVFEDDTTTLITRIGSSNFQYNATYEIASYFDIDFDGGLFDADDEANRNDYLENVFLVKETEDPRRWNENSEIGTIRSGDYEGFAGIYDWETEPYSYPFANFEYAENDQPPGTAGWVDLGGNGIDDIFQFTDLDMGTIVIGGFEAGDRFDFSLLNTVFQAGYSQINIQTGSTAHVATGLGNILVTQANGAAGDAVIWLNTDVDELTTGFQDFESSIYVVGGASMAWDNSHFMFPV